MVWNVKYLRVFMGFFYDFSRNLNKVFHLVISARKYILSILTNRRTNISNTGMVNKTENPLLATPRPLS